MSSGQEVTDGGAAVDEAAAEEVVSDNGPGDPALPIRNDDGHGGGHAAAAGGGRLGTLAHRLDALMTDDAMADCVVVVAGRRYPCVRVVLAQGSAYFRTMFFGVQRMVERDTGEASLEGVSRTGWEAVRLWLYTALVCLGLASSTPRVYGFALVSSPPLALGTVSPCGGESSIPLLSLL